MYNSGFNAAPLYYRAHVCAAHGTHVNTVQPSLQVVTLTQLYYYLETRHGSREGECKNPTVLTYYRHSLVPGRERPLQ